MRALFDVNVIIALLDPDHVFHERAHQWWDENRENGWASSPVTENGVVRVMSNPNYSRNIRFTPQDLIVRLLGFAQQSNHEFWADNISIRDQKIFSPDRIHGSRQLTDIYLLALAVSRSARLATFDQGVPISAAAGAKPADLCIV